MRKIVKEEVAMLAIEDLILKEFWNRWRSLPDEAKQVDVHNGFSGLRIFVSSKLEGALEGEDPLPIIFLSLEAFQEFTSPYPQNDNENRMIFQASKYEGLECVRIQTMGESYKNPISGYVEPIKEVFFFKREQGYIYSLRNYIITNGKNYAKSFFSIPISKENLKKILHDIQSDFAYELIAQEMDNDWSFDYPLYIG